METKIPKSIPAKYRKHIQFYDDERHLDQGIIVTLVGLAYQDANSEGALHLFGEDTIEELKFSLSKCRPCNCSECQKYAGTF